MKKTKFVLGATTILALALLGSSCATQETNDDSMNDSQERMENSSDSMMNNDSMNEGESMEDTNAAAEGEATFAVNTTESNMRWVGKKVGGQHEGDIKISNGSFEVTDGVPVSGTFTIDMDSLTVTDIEDEESNKGLVDHLKNEDFFATSEFPTATFELTNVTSQGGNSYMVEGDLTIKGITESISFPATIASENGQFTATGTIEVDRTVFDIRYGSGKFFDNLGDRAIDDTFTLDLDLVASEA